MNNALTLYEAIELADQRGLEQYFGGHYFGGNGVCVAYCAMGGAAYVAEVPALLAANIERRFPVLCRWINDFPPEILPFMDDEDYYPGNRNLIQLGTVIAIMNDHLKWSFREIAAWCRERHYA